MADDKQAQMRAQELERPWSCVGRTVSAVLTGDTELKIRFTDGSVLEVGCYTEQHKSGDFPRLSFDFESTEGC